MRVALCTKQAVWTKQVVWTKHIALDRLALLGLFILSLSSILYFMLKWKHSLVIGFYFSHSFGTSLAMGLNSGKFIDSIVIVVLWLECASASILSLDLDPPQNTNSPFKYLMKFFSMKLSLLKAEFSVSWGIATGYGCCTSSCTKHLGCCSRMCATWMVSNYNS
jgi:hypothetical protein